MLDVSVKTHAKLIIMAFGIQRYILSKFTSTLKCIINRNATTSPPIKLSPTIRLYENDKIKPKYFRIITVVSGVQLFFWSYLSYFALTEFGNDDKADIVRDPTSIRSSYTTEEDPSYDSHKKKATSESSPQTLTSWFGSSKWRIGLSLLSLGAGVFFAVTACMYPMRIVRKLTFVRADQALQFVTYNPLGKTRVLQVPVTNVKCASSETQKASGSHIALKLQGYRLYFLLDQQETYLNPLLYNLIGTKHT